MAEENDPHDDARADGADDKGRIVGYTLAVTHQTFFADGPVGWTKS